MTMEELHRKLMENRKEIERVSNLIDNMHKHLNVLLDKDTDLYYELLKREYPDGYDELIKRIQSNRC